MEVEDTPGSLDRVVEALDGKEVNIEYMYTFFKKKGENAIVVFKTDDTAVAVDWR